MKFNQKATTKQTAQLLANAGSIAIFSHTRPDGDTVGASVALCLALRKLGKTVELFCDDALGESMLQFAFCGEYKTAIDGKFDTFVAVDCASLNRLGELADGFYAHRNTLTIDHHANEMFSAHNLIKPYASTCQIVLEVIDEMGVGLDTDIATYLYMGLVTDTGNFAHSNTDRQCFDMASRLVSYGVDIEKVSRVFFKDITLANTKLLANVLAKARTYFDDRLVLLYVTEEDLAKYNLLDEATEGLVQYAINVDTAMVGVCLCQYGTHTYKVSMRGKNGADVRSVCTIFGGGGHTVAAGCMMSGFLEDVIDKIVKAVGDLLDA
jgi:phosphoesterase RecJ-like protein